VESLGYPKRVRGVGTSAAATWMFQAGCMYDCGSILLDRVSLVCEVVEFVGMCAAMLRMSWGEGTLLIRPHLQHVYIPYTLSTLRDKYIISFNINNC